MSQPVSDGATVRREFHGPPVDVWEQLTGPEGFEGWMGPGSTIEPEPDGDLIAGDPERGVPKIGRVIDAEPQRRLRWVWRPLGNDPDAVTEVLVELEPIDRPIPGTAVPDTAVPGPAVPGTAIAGTVITVTEWPSTGIINPIEALASVGAGCSL